MPPVEPRRFVCVNCRCSITLYIIQVPPRCPHCLMQGQWKTLPSWAESMSVKDKQLLRLLRISSD